jgi:hypothetical protein
MVGGRVFEIEFQFQLVLSLVLGLVLSKDKVQGLGASAWCPVWVLSKQARIRCGFPVKKSISVRIRYKSGGLAMGSSGCGAGAVAVLNKQARVSKGLVLCAVRCGCKDAGLSQSKV